MSEAKNIQIIIADCIQNFRPKNSNVGDGTQRDAIYETHEHSQPLATAIWDALKEAGYEISHIGSDNA